MIRSLDDAWNWYSAVRTLAYDMRKLAGIWDNQELHEILSRAERLRERTTADLLKAANAILGDLDDLAVLVLFSVFEVTVRDRAKADVDRETVSIQHPAVLRAVKDLKEAIENGSFGRVTESYKAMDVDLTEQVNQVRKFRNWVAHGRRGEHENRVEPRGALDRLRRYLERLEEVEKAAMMGLPPDASRLDAEPERPPDVETSTQPDG
jgi:hypothetical protein